MRYLLAVALASAIAVSGFAGGQQEPGASSGQGTGQTMPEAKALTGAGSTFVAVLNTKLFSEYANLTGVEVNYQSIGSGGGIKSISDMTVDFGATDGPMTDDQLKAAKGGPILHIPETLGGVVPTYNIPDIPATPVLRFTPDTLAGIYLGTITSWNDPKLVADNPQLQNVAKSIEVVHRSDGSGTTNIWTSYLSAVNDQWAKQVGAANSVNWPVGLGGKGNEGVAGDVQQTTYSIGYVELAYAVQNKLPPGMVKNQAGNFVAANLDSVSLSAQGVTLPDDMRVHIVNSSNPKAYPITGFTWLLAYQNMTDASKALALTKLLWWMVHEGQKYSTDLYYAPLPPDVVHHAETLIKEISVNGVRALPATTAGQM